MHISLGARHDFLRRYGVAAEWEVRELGDLAQVVGGGTPSRDDNRYWVGGTIPWATPTDLTQNSAKYISKTGECITEAGHLSSAATFLPAGAILYTSRATIGAKAIAGVPITTNQGFASFIPHGIDGEYLYYLLDLLTPAIKRLGAGTTFDEVSKRDVRSVRCAVPADPNEQAAIARMLVAVDAALERTRAAVERARALRASIIADLLSRGVGEDGKVRPDTAAPGVFVVTPLGNIPSAWRLSTVELEFDLQNGFTLNAERRPRFRRRRYLRVANVQRDALDLADVQELEAGDVEFAPRVLAPDDLLALPLR